MKRVNTVRLRMNVSIAGTVEGRDFSAQPNDVIDIPADLGKKWIRSGHGTPAPDAELTERDLNLRDLSMEEALTRACEHCDKRCEIVFRNRGFCNRHYLAELEGM